MLTKRFLLLPITCSLSQIENDSFIHLKHLQRLELHGCALTTVEPLAFRGVEATLQVRLTDECFANGMNEYCMIE